MSVTVFLSSSPGNDELLADELARAIPRVRRRGGIQVIRDGDPAEADWLLFLASPESSRDPDVTAQLTRWLEVKGVERFQVVVTAGSWHWDAEANEIARESSAAPQMLRRAFPAEPRHLEFRGDRGARPTSRDPLFLDQVAEITAPMLGTTKDALTGEDVRRQRRTRTLTKAAAGALSVLLLIGVAGAVVSVNRAEASRESRAIALQQRDDSESRRLAALSGQVVNDDGALARLLAVEAWRISETAEARQALTEAAQVTGDWDVMTTSESVSRLIGHAFHPMSLDFSETHVATVDAGSTLRIWTLHDVQLVAEVGGTFGMENVAWAHDGSVVAAAGGRVHLFTAEGQPLGFAGPRSPAALVGAWGANGFVAAGGSIAVIQDREVLVERPLTDIGLTTPPVFVEGSADGERVLVASESGQIAFLDADLDVVHQWEFTVAVDQFGAGDSASVLAWDGRERVVLPPDNDRIRGPILDPASGPDPQDNAIAGIYDARTGEGIEPLISDGYFPVPATSGAILADGSAIAISPGGLEAPPAFGQTSTGLDLSVIPLPERANLIGVSPDNRWLAVAGSSVEAFLVPLVEPDQRDDTSGDPTVQACAAAGRFLSEAEWAMYLPDRDYQPGCRNSDEPS